MTRKTISVIVLTYNRKQLLQQCLDSLLAQEWAPAITEILVGDDGSTDGTGELIRRYECLHPHVRGLHHRHQGIAATRNLGIRAARGEIIAIVADDYILDAAYVRVIADFFQQNPRALVVRFKIVPSRADVGSRISHFYYSVSTSRRLREARVGPSAPEEITIRHDLEASGAAAFRREVFDRVGLFDEAFQRAEDSELTQRLRAEGIEIHYNPHLEIKHQYDRFMLDTLSKCFQTGWNRYHLYRKYPAVAGAGEGYARSLLVRKLRALFETVWRGSQTDTVVQSFAYLPFMVIFEGTNKLGFLFAWLSSHWRDPEAPASARSPSQR